MPSGRDSDFHEDREEFYYCVTDDASHLPEIRAHDGQLRVVEVGLRKLLFLCYDAVLSHCWCTRVAWSAKYRLLPDQGDQRRAWAKSSALWRPCLHLIRSHATVDGVRVFQASWGILRLQHATRVSLISLLGVLTLTKSILSPEVLPFCKLQFSHGHFPVHSVERDALNLPIPAFPERLGNGTIQAEPNYAQFRAITTWKRFEKQHHSVGTFWCQAGFGFNSRLSSDHDHIPDKLRPSSLPKILRIQKFCRASTLQESNREI